jgi:hypothetical protein
LWQLGDDGSIWLGALVPQWESFHPKVFEALLKRHNGKCAVAYDRSVLVLGGAFRQTVYHSRAIDPTFCSIGRSSRAVQERMYFVFFVFYFLVFPDVMNSRRGLFADQPHQSKVNAKQTKKVGTCTDEKLPISECQIAGSKDIPCGQWFLDRQ